MRMEKLWLFDSFKDIIWSLKKLKNSVLSSFSDIFWKKEKQETESARNTSRQQQHELKEEMRDKNRESNWKYTISEWIFPSASNMRFGVNWSNKNAKIIMNWPLFWSGWKPVWWYIENWNVVKNFETKVAENQSWNFYKNNWIIWYGTDWKMHMFSFHDIKEQSGNTITKQNWEKITFKRAFQNGPMLVQNWDIKTSSNSKKVDRTAIWFTASWEIRCVQVKQASLVELANFCKEKWLTNTMYLDGSQWIAWMQNWATWQKFWWIRNWVTWIQLW